MASPVSSGNSWEGPGSEVRVDLSLAGPLGGTHGLTVTANVRLSQTFGSDHDLIRILEVTVTDDFEFSIWARSVGNKGGVHTLEVDYPVTGNTKLSVKEFWTADDLHHDYLFAFTGEGKCLALRRAQKQLELGGFTEMVVENISKAKHSVPLSVMQSMTIGPSHEDESCPLKSVSNVCIWGRAVTWDMAFPAKGTKRRRAEAESAAGMRSMWDCRKFTDFTVRCGGKSFPVHRAVLATKSNVFASMFEKDMREKAEQSITIQNADSSTAEALLSYVYLGSIPEASDNFRLLQIADQYNVEGLVELCAESIKDDFSEDTAVNIMLGLKPLLHIGVVAKLQEELIAKTQKLVAVSSQILKGLLDRAT